MNTVSSPPLPARPLALPNLLTYARIAAVPVVVALMYWHSILDGGLWLRWVALAVFIAAGITDVLDGYFARIYGQQSSLGRMLDPIADKLLVASCLLMLAAEETIRGWSLLAAVIILCREILVSGLREYLAELRVSVPVSRLAKWKTTWQLVAVGLPDRRRCRRQGRLRAAEAGDVGHHQHRAGAAVAVRPGHALHRLGLYARRVAAYDRLMKAMKLVYFAWVRERVGKAEEEIVPPPSVTTVAELMRWLGGRGEEYAHAFENPKVIRAAIDKSHVRPDTAIAGAREIAFFPPMTGG